MPECLLLKDAMPHKIAGWPEMHLPAFAQDKDMAACIGAAGAGGRGLRL